MKRFLENKIVTAQWDKGYLTPYVSPQTFEAKFDKVLEDMTDEQRAQKASDVANEIGQITSNENEAKSIFKQNGMSEAQYEQEKQDSYDLFAVPPLQFNQFIIGLWPKVRSKNISFKKFLYLFGEVADRYNGSATEVENFFNSFISILPNLEKTLGTSDEVIDRAVKFILTPGKSAQEFQDYLLYQTLLKYSLFNEIPEDKRTDILKATEQLEKIRTKPTQVEQEYLEFLKAKAFFLKEMGQIYQDFSLALLEMQKNNYSNILGVFKNGLNFKAMEYYLNNFRKGMQFGEFQKDIPFALNPNKDISTGTPVGEGRKSNNYVSDKIRRQIFASADNRKETIEKSGIPAPARPSAPAPSTAVTTDSGSFTSIYGKFVVDINEFEITVSSLVKKIDEEINYILNKQSSSSPQIGPFASGNVFQYLQDENESLLESDRILLLIDDVIDKASDLKISLIEKIKSTSVTGSAQIRQKETAITVLNEKFDLFRKDMRSKQLGLKFNKVLLSRQNEYSETEDLYNNLKIDMENNVSARPVIAPKAVLTGFRMADILEEIAEEFKNIAGNNPLRQEQAMKTARRWENFAKQQRATVFTEIYPAMAQSIGIEATKPTISPSFSLRGAFVDNVINLRTAGKFMNKEVESDKRFRDYWNNLFMQSKDPRPMGDIIEEKPKHSNLTTEEDAKLHKKTMRKFKKPESKKPRFKKDNN